MTPKKTWLHTSYTGDCTLNKQTLFTLNVCHRTALLFQSFLTRAGLYVCFPVIIQSLRESKSLSWQTYSYDWRIFVEANWIFGGRTLHDMDHQCSSWMFNYRCGEQVCFFRYLQYYTWNKSSWNQIALVSSCNKIFVECRVSIVLWQLFYRKRSSPREKYAKKTTWPPGISNWRHSFFLFLFDEWNNFEYNLAFSEFFTSFSIKMIGKFREKEKNTFSVGRAASVLLRLDKKVLVGVFFFDSGRLWPSTF